MMLYGGHVVVVGYRHFVYVYDTTIFDYAAARPSNDDSIFVKVNRTADNVSASHDLEMKNRSKLNSVAFGWF